jgi:hypothetical protein
MHDSWSEKDRATWQKINEIDFSEIRYSLVDEIVTNEFIRSYVGNDRDDWIEKSERDYKAFLFICYKYSDRPIVPTWSIDVFWHKHILYTQSYTDVCQELFGRYLHHEPLPKQKRQVVSDGPTKEFLATRELFAREFGNSPLAHQTPDGPDGGHCKSGGCEVHGGHDGH